MIVMVQEAIKETISKKKKKCHTGDILTIKSDEIRCEYSL